MWAFFLLYLYTHTCPVKFKKGFFQSDFQTTIWKPDHLTTGQKSARLVWYSDGYCIWVSSIWRVTVFKSQFSQQVQKLGPVLPVAKTQESAIKKVSTVVDKPRSRSRSRKTLEELADIKAKGEKLIHNLSGPETTKLTTQEVNWLRSLINFLFS